MELSEQAAQELAEGSTAISRVAELEARVAELEARDRQLEADKVKDDEALRKEKHGKDSERCLPSSLCTILSLTCFCLELEACTKANEELQKLRDVVEQQARCGTIWKSYCYVLSVVFFGLG